MLQRDYIMRLIREFMAALQRLLEKNEITTRREEIKQLYEKYVGPYALYHNATTEEVMQALAGEDEEHRLYKLEILAELFHAEADMESEPFASFLLNKSLVLFEHLDRTSKVYSIDRKNKIALIKRKTTDSPTSSEQPCP